MPLPDDWRIEKIHRRYNAENDTIPGGPMVTWAECDLAVVVGELFSTIETLQDAVIELDNRIKKLEASDD